VKCTNERVQKENRYVFHKGTTLFGKESIRDLIVREEMSVVATTAEAMDTT
jgi:hypothetical protein